MCEPNNNWQIDECKSMKDRPLTARLEASGSDKGQVRLGLGLGSESLHC